MRHRRNVLAIDQNLPLLGVIKPQEKLHEGRFPRTRAPNQADLFPRLNPQRHILQPAALAPVVMGQPAQLNRALFQNQIFGIGLIHQGDRLRDGFHPFGDNPEGAEKRAERPHDPAGHRIQPQRERGGRRDNPDRSRTLRPEPNGPTDNPDDQEPIQRGQRHIHRGKNPHLTSERLAGVFNRLFGVVQLAVVMREELHRMDIGVAIDHPARGHRPRIRAGL